MKAILNIFGILTSLIFGIFLFVLIAITPFLLGVSGTVTNRDSMKNVLLKSSLTELISDQIVSELSSQLKESGLPSKEVKKLEPTIKREISAEYIERNLTSIVDGGYDWFEGKTGSLKISSEHLKLDTLLSSLIPSKYLKNSGIAKGISGLKTCKDGQTSFLESTKKIESLDQLCIPKEIDVISLLKQTEMTEQKLPLNVQNTLFSLPNTTSEYLETAKLVFSILLFSYLILGLIITILAVIFVLIPPAQKIKSLILSIYIICISGFNYILFSTNTVFNIVKNIINSKDEGDNTQIPIEILISIVEKMYEEASMRIINASLILLFIGIVILIVTIIVWRNSTKKLQQTV